MRTVRALTILLAVLLGVAMYPVVHAMVKYGEPNVYRAYMKEKCIEIKDPQQIWYACDFPKLPGTYQSYITVGKEKK